MNVRDFGAVGNGVVDDTFAVQAAIDALRGVSGTGGRVRVPPGTFLLTDSLRVGYAITLEGANPAASRLIMRGDIQRDMVVGDGSFPVYVQLRDLTLDGGLPSTTQDQPPVGSGSVRLGNQLKTGAFTSRVALFDSTTPIGPGDVLRAPGQPVIVVNDGREMRVGEDGPIYVCNWSPAVELDPKNDRWNVYRAGSLVRGCGRVSISNCFLMKAKRHAVELVRSTQGAISSCEIGNNQGCGVFSWSSTDYTVDSTWMYRNGGPDLYTYAAADVRMSRCILEGSGSHSVYADWGEVHVDSTGMWGARCGLVRAENCGTVRLSGLKLREPGFGQSDPSTFASVGFGPLSARPAIYAHFASTAVGLHLSGTSLEQAQTATGPIVWIANGGRSNLSGLEWSADISFSGGDDSRRIVRDEGDATIIRGCRGVADVN